MELNLQRQPTAQKEHVWEHGRQRPEGKACNVDSSRYIYRLERGNSFGDFFFFLTFLREKSGQATLKLCDLSQEGRVFFLYLSQFPSTHRNSSSQGGYVDVLS